MLEPGPFDPIIYWVHVILGATSVLAALVAVLSKKGSHVHKTAGKVFGIAMIIAALSAFALLAVRFAVPAVVSAISTVYGIIAGVLALKQRFGVWAWLERIFCLIPLGLVGLLSFVIFTMVTAETPPPLPLPASIGIVALIFGLFVISDWRFFRQTEPSKQQRYRRHTVRMALAVCETLRAPLISFAPPVFGPASFMIYFIGPFLLIPLIYYLAVPKWAKTGH